MPIKLFFFFAVLVTALHAAGQEIGMKHLMACNENSKTVYVGTENKFLVSGAFDQLKTEGNVKSYDVRNDTLVIMPPYEGNMNFSFITKTGTQQVVFTARRLPPLVINLGGENKSISKENCRKNHQLSFFAKDGYFEHFKVDSSVVIINGQIFISNGDCLSAATLQAIDKAKSGDKLDFTYVHAVEDKSGMKVAGQTSFLLQ